MSSQGYICVLERTVRIGGRIVFDATKSGASNPAPLYLVVRAYEIEKCAYKPTLH